MKTQHITAKYLSPFSNLNWMNSLFKHIDNLEERFGNSFIVPNFPSSNFPYDIWYVTNSDGTIEKYVIEMSLVGIDKQNVKIQVGETLEIVIDDSKVPKKEEESDSKRVYIFRSIDRSQTKGKIEFTLTDTVDKQNIVATYKNGILQIVVPVHKFQQTENVINVNIKDLED